MSAISSNNVNVEAKVLVNFTSMQIGHMARFTDDLHEASLLALESVTMNFTYNQLDTAFSSKILKLVKESANPRRNYDREVGILSTHYATELPDIVKRANDSGKIINEMGRLFKFLNENNKARMGLSRIYEINVMLRHPAITDKAELFAAIANNLSEAKDETDYANRVCNLNDVTPHFMNRVFDAERAAGASINGYWPHSYADSTQHPFAVTDKK